MTAPLVPGLPGTSGVVGRAVGIVVIGDGAAMSLFPDEAPHDVRWARPGPDSEHALQGFHAGVVVVVVPPADEAVVRQVASLRRVRPAIRAMLVDTATSPGLRLTALEAGFDEALEIEIEDREVVGRIAILLARAMVAVPSRLPVGVGVELDIDARALRVRGRFVRLRPLEYRLLEELCRAPGRPLGRAWLLERAWGVAPPAGSRTLDVHVRWLREKVERDPDHPVHLLTVRGVGYQLEPHDPDDATGSTDAAVDA